MNVYHFRLGIVYIRSKVSEAINVNTGTLIKKFVYYKFNSILDHRN